MVAGSSRVALLARGIRGLHIAAPCRVAGGRKIDGIYDPGLIGELDYGEGNRPCTGRTPKLGLHRMSCRSGVGGIGYARFLDGTGIGLPSSANIDDPP